MYALCLGILLLAAPAPPSKSDGQLQFEAATALEGKGDFAAAADALEKLARTRPDDSFADDALFEAAVLAEERLSDPARSARLYEEVATRYASSRLARRARTRADFLASSLKTGEGPLREYQEILNGFSRRPPAESAARMEKLLATEPGFALADRATYWLGSAYVDQHRPADALARFLDVERRFPRTEWASRAKKARGDLALRSGHPFAARRIYLELAGEGDLLGRAAAEEGLALAAATIRRTVFLVGAIGYLLAFLIAHGLAMRKWSEPGRRFRPPTEMLFYGPVALLFVAAAATENSSIALATLGIALGGGVVVWAASAVTSARIARGLDSLAARIVRLAASGLAVVAVMYVSVQATGLTDLIVETLRSGPER